MQSARVSVLHNRALLLLAIGLIWLWPAPVASRQVASDEPDREIQGEGLRAGQFIWTKEADEASNGPILVVVLLGAQRARVYRGGVLIAVSTISSGRRGYPTPTGVFSILQKERFHRSNLYDDAPMPFMMRLTWAGLAMHAGVLPGYPASHGCIRLPARFASKLFSIVSYDTRVVVTHRSDVSNFEMPAPEGLEPEGSENESSDAEFRLNNAWTFWLPDIAPEGPFSILVSAADKSIVVLRLGIEIGRAPIEVDGGRLGTYALFLAGRERGASLWMRVTLHAEDDEGASDLDKAFDPIGAGRVSMPEAFRQKLIAAMTPGATIFYTDRPIVSRLDIPLTLFADRGGKIR